MGCVDRKIANILKKNFYNLKYYDCLSLFTI
jgi:hypothetical protein